MRRYTYRVADVSTFNKCLTDKDLFLLQIDLLAVYDAFKAYHEIKMDAHVGSEDRL